jgi:adhesin/invasin
MTRTMHGTHTFSILRGGLVAFLVLGALVAGGCEQALTVAPSSSVLVISAPKTSVDLNGTMTVSAVLTDDTGAAVADGTLMIFTSTLGTISPYEAKTSNGRASVTLAAGSVAGTASITATSGSITSNTLSVTVGTVPARIVLSSSISGSVASITATVYDATGAPVPGTPVAFATTAGTLATSSVSTNTSGQAFTSLYGSADAVVTATATGASTSIYVLLGSTGVISVNLAVDPEAPTRNEAMTFTATVASSSGSTVSVSSYQWVFSDGLTVITSGNTTSRSFSAEGTYSVTLTVTTTAGSVGTSRLEFYVD